MGAEFLVICSPTLHTCPECGRPWFGTFFQKDPERPTTDGGDIKPPTKKPRDGRCGTCGRPL